MKRRGFLKAMGIGAAAAPIVSQGAFAGSGNMLSKAGGTAMVGGYGMDKVAATEGDWRAEQIKSLKAIINGGISEEEKAEIKRRRFYQRESAIRESVACLQSVSQTRKLEMVHDRLETHEERMVIERAKERLHWLLKEML